MIKRLEIKLASALWHIDGVEISMFHRLNITADVITANIEAYRNVLRSGSYEQDNSSLREAFRFFGGISFVAIGYTAYHEDFLKMFRHYTRQFVMEWYESGKCIHSKEVGIGYVFEAMLRGKGYTIRYNYIYILEEIDNSHLFVDIVNEEFGAFWTGKIKEAMERKDSLRDIAARIGVMRVGRYCITMLETTTGYLRSITNGYTERRERISEHKLNDWLLGESARMNLKGCDKDFLSAFKEAVRAESEVQSHKFIMDNRFQLDVNKDVWVLYKKHGPSLYYNRMDFTIINSHSMRLEVKHYMKQRFMADIRIKDRFLSRIAYAVNLMTLHNPNIRYFADVDDVDAKTLHITLENAEKTNHGKEKTQINIMNVFSSCKIVCAYLMGNMRDESIKSPRPYQNPFAKFIFRNSKDYVKNTPVIPEQVMEQIEAHIGELQKVYQLMFKIFANTGMRAKEVLFLEADCLEKSKYEGYIILKYKPYKVLSARRKANVGDYHRVLVPCSLADEIHVQIKATGTLRDEYGLSYVFIRKRKNFKVNMLNMPHFTQIINKLIERYGICDETGELWHFTSRQYRKTLAVTLIENGATVEELAYWLGHLHSATAARYYAEVRKTKLAEMNTQFFKDKFDLILSGEQLAEYSEEERRLLYIDFRLEQRKVELGCCLKKAADGGCTNRSSMYNCVNCKNLCTGKKYLPYWQELLEQQKTIVNDLLMAYAKNNIHDYASFKEYRQESFLLVCYQNIVNSIVDSEVSK